MALSRSWRSRRAARVGVAAASSWSSGDQILTDAFSSISARYIGGASAVKHIAGAKTGPTFSAAPIGSEKLLHLEAEDAYGEIAKLSIRNDSESSDSSCRVCDHEYRNGTSSEGVQLRHLASEWRNRWIVTRNSNFGANLRGEVRNYTTGRSFSPSWQRRCEGFNFEGKHGNQSQQFLKFLFHRVQIRSHMGHAHPPESTGGREKEGQDVLGLGLWGDVVLAIGKGGAGYLSGSKALLADAAHSVSDIALSAVALWTSKIAYAPKDKQHPYGHGKYESVGALGISGVLILTGVGIAWQSIETLQA